MLCCSGDVYEGDFRHGEKSGTGYLRFTPSPTCVHTAGHQGQEQGQQVVEYRGQFEHDSMHGTGGRQGGREAAMYVNY